jgi:hypothetical protein
MAVDIRERFDRGEVAVRFPEHPGTNLCSAFHPSTAIPGMIPPELELIDVVYGGMPGLGVQDIFVTRRT